MQSGSKVTGSSSNTSHASVRAAQEADRQTASGTVLLAFSTDPFARWVFPNPATYVALSPEFGDAFAGSGYAHGSVDMLEDGSGVAFWLPPGVEPDGERMQAIVEQAVPADRLQDLGGVIEEMGKSHPQEPCWYLPIIGVDPAMQGRGVGSALLRYALARSDADGVPAYLESSNPRNIALYERHGFEVIRTIQVGSSPPVVPMIRRPH